MTNGIANGHVVKQSGSTLSVLTGARFFAAGGIVKNSRPKPLHFEHPVYRTAPVSVRPPFSAQTESAPEGGKADARYTCEKATHVAGAKLLDQCSLMRTLLQLGCHQEKCYGTAQTSCNANFTSTIMEYFLPTSRARCHLVCLFVCTLVPPQKKHAWADDPMS